MKKIIFLFSLLFMPIMCCGLDDACTKPKEYTIDKRCYVADSRKNQKPYNAVVRIDGNTGYCVGTIVKGEDGEAYLYTAKHCTDDDRDYQPDNVLVVDLQDGRKLNATKIIVGDYDYITKTNPYGDWAVYKMPVENVAMVERTNNTGYELGPWDIISYDAKVVGYGALKIMSDKEINDFKQKYMKYLRNKKNIKSDGTEDIYGFYKGGVRFYDSKKENLYVQNFLKDNKLYMDQLYSSQKDLKESVCKYTIGHRQLGCQTWTGDSGAPIFDNNNKIMGIVTQGIMTIGGDSHAGSQSRWSAISTNSVSLLK